MSLNRVMIIGHVVRDPELRYMPSGQAVSSFCVATTRSWTNANGARHEETEWFNVVAWDQLAEVCKEALHKDAQVYVEGRLQTRGWEDQNKKQHFRTELVAQKMIKLGGPAPAQSEGNCYPEEEQAVEGEASF